MWRSAPSSPSCSPSSDRFLLGHINTAERGSETAAEPEKSDVRTNNTVSKRQSGRSHHMNSLFRSAVEVRRATLLKILSLSIYIGRLPTNYCSLPFERLMIRGQRSCQLNIDFGAQNDQAGLKSSVFV